MFMQDYGHQFSSSEKMVKVYKNGDSSMSCDIRITSTTKFYEIRKQLEQKMRESFQQLRIFNQQGVELMEDEVEFVKSGAVLYVSQGEDFDANSSFSEFEIIKELGEGGFGKVMLGKHRSTKELFAIKIIKTQMIGNAQDIDMVFREAEILKSLNHKNIVKILNSFTLSNMQVVFIMEYLEGGELLDYIVDKGGHLDEEEARHFFRQLVSAIAYCHSNKLIHRDLKLENLLLASKGCNEIKAIDFGIAGMSSNFNVDSADAGSLRYMAPEVLKGTNGKITPLVDVWAMGIILYGMLFGTLPFLGNNNKEIAAQIMEGYYEIPAEFKNSISKDCKDCLRAMLEVDPNKRISAVDLQYHKWLKEKASHSDYHQEAKTAIQEIEDEDEEEVVKQVQTQASTNKKLTKKTPQSSSWSTSSVKTKTTKTTSFTPKSQVSRFGQKK